MLDKIFNFLGGRTEEPSSLTDFSLMAVDLHSHLIPGIDDGVRTIQDSLDALRQFQRLGFKKVITTPHVMADGFNNTSETILSGRDKVREAIRQSDIQIEFDVGAEYYLDETMYEKVEKKNLLAIGKEYVLVELSFFAAANNTFDLVYKMQVAGYNVILAHPERYPYYYEKNFEKYNSLKDHGIFFQINLMSLIGKYGERAKAIAEKLIDERMVEFVGSDLHGPKHFQFIRATLKEKYLEKILTSEALLNKTLL
ncbi:MAG: CpsB/CapC family capsule biosynthesis tyrosine phosphatase [Bacteroidota bacterium]